MLSDTKRLKGLVVFWTILTTLFAWLPLVRIVGRPDGYTWGFFGFRGEGAEGPFWIFVVATLYALTLLYSLQRGPRALSHPMLVMWHTFVAGLVVYGTLQAPGATLEGQGLRFSIPLWTLCAPFVAFTLIAYRWVIVDLRNTAQRALPWSRSNRRRLAVSIVLLAVALLLFRAGTNYNWVTACAIIVTVVQWILLAESFEPKAAKSFTG